MWHIFLTFMHFRNFPNLLKSQELLFFSMFLNSHYQVGFMFFPTFRIFVVASLPILLVKLINIMQVVNCLITMYNMVSTESHYFNCGVALHK